MAKRPDVAFVTINTEKRTPRNAELTYNIFDLIDSFEILRARVKINNSNTHVSQL